jgi:serine/threonine protein phosphatase 1
MAELAALELEIARNAAGFDGEKWIVMLGDYVDRGPRSAEVLGHLIAAAPTGFERICLAGNHESMMLQFLHHPTLDSAWLLLGGEETLRSYGVDMNAFRRASHATRRAMLTSSIPSEHVEFLTELPVLLSIPGFNFVHAGLRPGVPLEQQSELDLLWIREPFLSQSGSMAAVTVHGHTPFSAPVCVDRRVGIDTGAFASGVLTAARIGRNGTIVFLATEGNKMAK